MMASRPELYKRFNYTNPRQKRVVQSSPDRQNKRRRLVTELNSPKDEEMRKCGVILEKLMNHKHVDASGLRDYRKIVRCPMDLATVELKLHMGAYQNSLQFAKDVRLTFHFARLSNRRGHDVHTMATVLLDLFDKLFDSINQKFEQRELRKPLAEITKSRLVSSLQNAEKPLQMENPRMRREMSDLERDHLGLLLQDFADEYLVEILQIVAKRNSNMTTPAEDGEIELDIHAVDNETMWDLHKFVRLKLKAEQNNKII